MTTPYDPAHDIDTLYFAALDARDAYNAARDAFDAAYAAYRAAREAAKEQA